MLAHLACRGDILNPWPSERAWQSFRFGLRQTAETLAQVRDLHRPFRVFQDMTWHMERESGGENLFRGLQWD